MYVNKLLPEKLLTHEYYINHLPLYLRNDENFCEHFNLFVDLLVGDRELKGLATSENVLLSLCNIFSETYLEDVKKICEDGETLNFLDLLGDIFGVRRNLSVEISGTTSDLNLTDEEFLLLIKSQIIKNYFSGSRADLQKYYDSTGLRIYSLSGDGSGNSAFCREYLSTSVSDNIQDLFLSGLLTLESMGIVYTRVYQTIENISKWDQSNWDESEWDV